MSLPITATTQTPYTDTTVTGTRLVTPKLAVPNTFVGRGTYEGLGGSGSVVKQVDQGQTGQGLRESLVRNKELGTAAKMVGTNALVSRAGCPRGSTKQSIAPPPKYSLCECSDNSSCGPWCDDLAQTNSADGVIWAYHGSCLDMPKEGDSWPANRTYCSS